MAKHYTAAQYQRRRANFWMGMFFGLLILSFVACLYVYFKGHVHGQEFIEKRAGAQMYFSNHEIAGIGADTLIRVTK